MHYADAENIFRKIMRTIFLLKIFFKILVEISLKISVEIFSLQKAPVTRKTVTPLPETNETLLNIQQFVDRPVTKWNAAQV